MTGVCRLQTANESRHRPQSPTLEDLGYLKDLLVLGIIRDSIVITVRDSLKLNSISDTTVCYLEDVSLTAIATGGKPSDYQFTWLPTNVVANPLNTEFSEDQLISVSISDGCTQQ